MSGQLDLHLDVWNVPLLQYMYTALNFCHQQSIKRHTSGTFSLTMLTDIGERIINYSLSLQSVAFDNYVSTHADAYSYFAEVHAYGYTWVCRDVIKWCQFHSNRKKCGGNYLFCLIASYAPGITYWYVFIHRPSSSWGRRTSHTLVR